MVRKNITKKGISSLAIGVIGALVLGGAYMYSQGMISTPQMSVDNVNVAQSTNSFSVYTNDVTSSLGTVTSTGVGANEEFTIEIDKDTLVANSNLDLNLTVLQDIPDGTSYNSNLIQPHTIKVPISSDINVHDVNGDEYILIDESASRIDGQRDYKKIDFTGSTSQVVPVTLKINPNSFNLSNAVEIDELGEKLSEQLDFGLKNKVKLVIKN